MFALLSRVQTGALPTFAVADTDHLRMVEQVALAYPGFAPRITLLGQKGLSRWLRDIGLFRNPRLPMLIDALPFLRQFDAIVVPERTTTAIRHFLSLGTRLIFTPHGAGDRAITFDGRADGKSALGEKSGSVRCHPGGGLTIKKKKKRTT